MSEYHSQRPAGTPSTDGHSGKNHPEPHGTREEHHIARGGTWIASANVTTGTVELPTSAHAGGWPSTGSVASFVVRTCGVELIGETGQGQIYV
jgi:hypothetical protein